MRWIFLAAGIAYVAVLVIVWSALRAASWADQLIDDLEPNGEPARPCPVCDSTDVYVDGDAVCFCITCRASYSLNNWNHLP